VAGERSGLLTAGGVLAIISGVLGLPLGLIFIGCGTVAASVSGNAATILVTLGIIMLVPSMLAFIGGRRALNKTSFGWALTGAIASILCTWLLGVLATIFVAMSKSEFSSTGE
jgi:hypothetical protein